MNGKDDKTFKRGEYDLPATVNDDVPIIARLNLDTLQINLNTIKSLAKSKPIDQDDLDNIILYVNKTSNMVDKIIVENSGKLIDRRIRERRIREGTAPLNRREDNRRKENLGRGERYEKD